MGDAEHLIAEGKNFKPHLPRNSKVSRVFFCEKKTVGQVLGVVGDLKNVLITFFTKVTLTDVKSRASNGLS